MREREQNRDDGGKSNGGGAIKYIYIMYTHTHTHTHTHTKKKEAEGRMGSVFLTGSGPKDNVSLGLFHLETTVEIGFRE